jgi:hypothetical protein
MKTLNLMIMVALLAGGAVAQTQSKGPGLEVIKNKWRPEAERNYKLEQDPLALADRVRDQQESIKQILYDNQALAKANLPLLPVPNRIFSNGSTTTPAAATNALWNWGWYHHEITVRNTGTKTIRALVWEYAFSDPTAKLQIRQHQYHKTATIKPGKTRNLSVRVHGVPNGVITANNGGAIPAANSPQQVIIVRVEYADGTFWTR